MTDAQAKPREWTLDYCAEDDSATVVRGPDVFGRVYVIESTPETRAASEMRNELEFACKYFRSAWTAQSDCMHEPEYQMWQGFEKLLKRIADEEKS